MKNCWNSKFMTIRWQGKGNTFYSSESCPQRTNFPNKRWVIKSHQILSSHAIYYTCSLCKMIRMIVYVARLTINNVYAGSLYKHKFFLQRLCRGDDLELNWDVLQRSCCQLSQKQEKMITTFVFVPPIFLNDSCFV